MSDTVDVYLPKLTDPQWEIIQIDERPERCWDVEGAARSAKSWGIGFWLWKLVLKYPGISIFYCRYKDDNLNTLFEVWSKVSAHIPGHLHPKWNTRDNAWDFPNKSRIYVSSLRVAEAVDNEAVHGKYKGKTIAVVVIEEAQEVPHINYLGLKERLSQSRTPDGVPFRYPLKIVLVHNSVDRDHWIAKEEFPLAADGETCTREDHAHIRADLYSNQHNLGPDVMRGYEFDYPPEHPLFHSKISGRRGVSMLGHACYGPVFKRLIHVHPGVKFTPYYPIIEGWDFGEEKPAVVWMQHLEHRAAIRILGAVKGSELFLEQFAPKVLEIRQRLFPQCKAFRTWCDPSGATGNGGLQYTPVQLLHDLGIPARPCRASEGARDGNDAEVRYKAIQTIAGYMLKNDTSEPPQPAFRMAPLSIELEAKGSELIEESSSILVQAFEVGYIWDERAPSDAHPNIRKPKKGTRFDDLMNALEYCVIGENIPIAPSVKALSHAVAQYQDAPAREALAEQISQARQLKLAQRDRDPSDRRVGRGSRRGVL